jgi:hypothetical protein
VETQEAKEMRSSCLKGALLGLSLALLLVGGAVLAQGLSVTADQDCFECWPRSSGWPPPDDHMVELTVSGYDMGDLLCARLTIPGGEHTEGCGMPAQAPPCTVEIGVECTTMLPYLGSDCWTFEAAAGDVTPSQVVYGEWVWRLWQEDDGVSAGPVYATFTFAEVCEEEFVPEPGSILLLGSGLAGLAGYATLRWRTRE